LLAETAAGKFNFDHMNPPVSPVTGQPVQTWYRPGNLEQRLREVGADSRRVQSFLIANYLADNKDILVLFGYDQNSTLTTDDTECPDIMAVEAF
jgi:dipeptidyl-peptidase-3